MKSIVNTSSWIILYFSDRGGVCDVEKLRRQCAFYGFVEYWICNAEALGSSPVLARFHLKIA